MRNNPPYLCIVYTSRLVRELSDSEMKQLVESADTKNQQEEITGVLLRAGTRIIQYLEGPYQNITRLFNQINHDNRHIDVKVVHMDTVPERLFKTWNCLYQTMSGSEPEASLEVERMLKNHFRSQPALETAIAELIRKTTRTSSPN